MELKQMSFITGISFLHESDNVFILMKSHFQNCAKDFQIIVPCILSIQRMTNVPRRHIGVQKRLTLLNKILTAHTWMTTLFLSLFSFFQSFFIIYLLFFPNK